MGAQMVQEAVGDLATALAHAERLSRREPALAETQIREILRAVPGQRDAGLLLAATLRTQGRAADAAAAARSLVDSHSGWAAAHHELGLALAADADAAGAIAAQTRAVGLDPQMGVAWRALADQLFAAGDAAGADTAFVRYVSATRKDPDLVAAGAALVANRLDAAEPLLRGHLRRHPTDVAAIRMLAELAARMGRYGDAERLLARAVDLAPSFEAAAHQLALALYRQNKSVEALELLDRLLARQPDHPTYLNLKAACLVRIGEYEAAIEIYERVLAEHSQHARAWMSFGHALKTVGRQDDCIDAYRKAIALQPELGEAYWSLANLKTVKFTAEDRVAMQAQLARTDISDEDRFHLGYALGKAFEDAKDYAASFRHYEAGAALRRKSVQYDAAETTDHVARSRAVFTPELMAAGRQAGCPAPDPIFILGLPRAGSTLIEQILSSHSMVEGTMELPDIIAIAKDLSGRKKRSEASAYPEIMAALPPERLAELGEEFIARTRVHRKQGRPFFIDKMPNNFAHVGLIQMILPNARIIDARRHPMANGFSAFKQHFARGQGFSYDLSELGLYYRDYVELMSHFDAVSPGRVHRVIYENMVAAPEAEVRALLDYCGLEFEPACLKFYETERAVRTASSEQVRQPIFKDAVEHWRHYEPWLEPLKAALGPVLDTYPEAPPI
ncbi:tetratricopeptide repeat-containing sulfotransferase family protein [Brevundimonas sp.]|uniref:tetratricopeptide repeat-containing sulfotransferase family protein n=1 Tax=Brevundimonas sp. TaxID=1871086 RepID=UPI003BA91573